MKSWLAGVFLVVSAAQAQTNNLTLQIPPVKTSLNLEGHPVGITAWGTVSAAPSGIFRLAATVDLGEFQENLTPEEWPTIQFQRKP